MKENGIQPELPVYDSMQQCVAASGVPLSRLKKAKKAGCPAFYSNRVNLAQFLKWDYANGETGPDWSEEDRKFQAKRREIQLLRDQEKFWERADVERAIAGAIGIMFRELDRLFNIELPPQVKGLDEIGCQKHFLESAERCKRVLKAELKQYAAL